MREGVPPPSWLLLRQRNGVTPLSADPLLRYALPVSQLRKLLRAKRRSQPELLFARRARRFQSECGWCSKRLGEGDPVFAVGGCVHGGIDLSLVAGKVIELRFGVSDKIVLAAVTGFDSEAKAEGKDVVFMTCSDVCGREIKTAFENELARGLDFHEDNRFDEC
jgi:hypothetical protein